jgi:hypothetical protein
MVSAVDGIAHASVLRCRAADALRPVLDVAEEASRRPVSNGISLTAAGITGAEALDRGESSTALPASCV